MASMLTSTQLAFHLVQLEAEVLQAKAAAVLYAYPNQPPDKNIVLCAQLKAIRRKIEQICDDVLTGDESQVFLAK